MAVGEVSGGFTPSTGIAQLPRYGKLGVLDCGTGTENLARFLAISLYHPATVYIIQPRVRDSTAELELRSFESVQGQDPIPYNHLLQCSQLPYLSTLLSQRPVTCGQVAEIWVSLSVKSDGGFTGTALS